MIHVKQYSRSLAVAAVVTAACAGLAGTAAVAAPLDPPAPSAAQTAAGASITAHPSASSVKAWELFHVTGETTGLKAGSKVTLQQKQHGEWVSLPASVPITHDGTYSLGVKIGLTGRNDLRIVSTDTASPAFQVTVVELPPSAAATPATGVPGD